LLSVTVLWLSADMIDVTAPEEEIHIDADHIEYQEERRQIYCRGDVEIVTERGTIYAQQALVDFSSREIYASDEVRFHRTDLGEYQTENLRYNYEFDYLYAEEVEGHDAFVRFSMSEVHSHGQEEIVGQDGCVTHCELPHPHYRVEADEIEVYLNQRVYVRGALFRAGNVPFLYLPVYSRNLGKKSPWSVSAGYESEKGATTKVSYLFRQKYYADRQQEERLSRWSLLLQGDHYTRRGTGLHTYGKFGVLDDAWMGRLFGYYIEDDRYDFTRRLSDEELDNLIESGELDDKYKYDIHRYTLTSENRFELPRDWLWHLNFELHSDPDIYRDFIETDRPEQLRVQRGVESVFSRVFDDHYFSLSMRYKERLSRLQYRDTYKHWADDIEFDRIDYYRAQQQIPVASLERRYLPLSSHLMYKYQLDFFNVLDTGLMPQSTADERWLTGAMLDNRFFFNYYFTPLFSIDSESGLKSGYVSYDRDSYGDNRFERVEDQLDERPWLQPHMVEDAFQKIDSTQISGYSYNTLNYHPADNLRFYTFYNHVHNFGDTTGDFYQEIANHRYKEDVYPFLRETREVGAGFEHTWDSPAYRLNVEFGENLRSDLYPRETMRYVRGDVSVQNEDETFSLFAGPAWNKVNELAVFDDGAERQYEDFERDIYTLYAGFDLQPEDRWRWSLVYHSSWEKEDHPQRPDDRRTLDQVYSHLTSTLELQVSDRYTLNTHATYDIDESDFEYISVGLDRWLHCWNVGMNVQMRQNLDEFSRDYGDRSFRYAVHIGLEGIPGARFDTGDVAEGLAAVQETPARRESLAR